MSRIPNPASPAELTPAAAFVVCVFLVGRGGHGKTLLLRYLVENALAAGRSLVIADGDRTNRVLPAYFNDVLSPPGVEEATVKRWFEFVIEQMVEKRFNLIVDLGGGDQVLKRLALELSLASLLEENGVTSVMLHLLGPEVESLAYLNAVEKPHPTDPNGIPLFAPKNTALVLNEGLILDPTHNSVAVFQPIREHAVFQAARRRGAYEIVMPALLPALEVSRRKISFADAAARKAGGGLPPLGLADAQRVKLWQQAMRENFAPIAEWLP